MLPETRTFFVRGDDGEEYGPVDMTELREWVRENRAGLGTEVRRADSDGTWNTWQTFPELVALLAEVNATGPVPGLPGLALAPYGRRVLAFGLDMILVGIPILILCDVMLLIFFPNWVSQYVGSINQFMLDAESGNQHPFNPADPPWHAALIEEFIRDSALALYFAGFLIAHGQTPGKALLRLRVVDQLGQKPDLVKILIRTVILVFSIYLFFIPLTYAFFNPQRRALHDFIAGTYVVEA
jgi:uncharacterized RDD family membrane protein YckC